MTLIQIKFLSQFSATIVAQATTVTRHTVSRRSIMSKQAIPLLLGDWLALTLFVLVGQLDHGMVGANPLLLLLRSSAELVLPWTIIALLWGAYRMTDDTTARLFFGRSLTAWLVAAPLALLLRALLREQAAIIAIFMVVTIGLGGAFLLSWRGLFFLIWRRLRRSRRS
jgi:hypothetical protein